MSDRIALITGATRGIGLETARQLAAQGIAVLIGGRDLAHAEKVAGELRQQGYDAHGIELDVTNPAHHHAAAQLIDKKFGRLDILVNNAGIALEAGLRPSQVPVDTVRKIFETNFFAAIGLTQALLPLLRKSKAGRIVNLSSRLGSLSANASAPLEGWYDELGYNASKAALNMFTVLLSRELQGTGIHINSAHPGWVQTDMGGPDAPMAVKEGASTSVWLATLPEDGPNGGYFHKQEQLAW